MTTQARAQSQNDLDAVRKALAADARFSAWQVTHTRGRSTQRYDVFGVPETRRVVESETLDVRVHVEQGAAHIGESSFVVDRTAAVAPQLDAAFARARLVKNKRWTLPENDNSAAVVNACDARIVESAEQACDEIMGTIAKGSSSGTNGSIRCCAAEAFCDFRRVHLVSSRGLDRVREETGAYVEYVLLAKGSGSDETETYASTRARRLPELDLEARVAGDARAVSLALSATTPQTGVVDVVLTEQGIEEIYDAFVAHASGAAAWEGWSRLVAGQPVTGEGALEGEPLSLSSDPTVPGGLQSFAFDDVGLTGRRVDVIDGGVFAARPLDQRHACWLDQPASSSWGNVVIASGQHSDAALLQPGARPLLHLSRFSQLSPHPTTGAFSGEIRLGFVVDADGTAGGKPGQPIRGGSITGNVFDAFCRAHFSTERTVRGRLHAPRALRLDRVAITGG